ncbi:AAA family ATP:ADP antiporter [Tenacibaculum adriaticum]|uniref:ADP,ATP carrier protein n=1 Tax=Tenacibaculum adriaticum TaxID=413713 RepID=A0A5S5DP11_9FLAO|nr:Npt1/Npt2 family nucleotide transporter [Tenacibaculum adriaticum]TYP97414.1 AAA family ATP:ADP antiporter [Tenacibaculum adriaticum]
MAFKNILKEYLLKIFDIREDELRKTFLLQLNIFLLITTLLIVKPTINSLFLSELGSGALPLGYVLTAIAAIIGSYFYNKALEKTQLNRIIVLTLYGSIASLVFFGLAFKLNIGKGLLLYIPYIWVAIFGLLAASQFWILANLVYNIREAKRIFGFIGSGAIAGGIFGGYITSILAKFIAAEELLFVAALLLLICIPIVRYIWKNEVLKLNTFQISLRSDVKGENSFRLIRKSKLLSLIAVVIGLSVLVAKLVDYQYSDYASILIQDPEELASFFGFWLSTLSVVSLIVQLFFTKRIVGMFGVGKSLLWLPTGIFLGSFLLLVVPQLWVLVFIKIVDGSLKQSVNRAATELLSIPIPIEIKKKTKTFIDVVVDSIATGIAGFILIFFINGLDIPSKYVSLIIIGLISLWIYLILLLKNEYINAFKELILDINGNKKNNKSKETPITSIVDSVKKALKTGTENQVLYMLSKTLEIKDDRFFKEIESLLNHPSSKVRALAVENLYFLRKENLCELIEPMIYDADQEVTTAAFRYLLKHYEMDTIKLFDKYLSSNDLTIRNAALLGLSLELRNYEKLQLKFNLEKRIANALEEVNELQDPMEVKNKLLIILASIGNGKVVKFYTTISDQFFNPDQEVVRMALRSASKTLDSRFINAIIENLSRKENRLSATDALFSYGDSIIDILAETVIENKVDLEDARLIPSVIGKFNSRKAVKALMKLVTNTEHEVKISAIESLQKIKWDNNDIEIKDRHIIDIILDECDLYQNTLAAIHSQIVLQYKSKDDIESKEERLARTALIDLLENRLDRQLKRIFKFLGMKYPPDDIDPVLKVILEGEEEQRIHAIEFLDNILDMQLKRELIPIAESILMDTASEEQIKKLNIRVPSELECFTQLLKRNDNKLKLTVLDLIEKTNDIKFKPLVEMILNNTDKKIKNKASEILAKY